MMKKIKEYAKTHKGKKKMSKVLILKNKSDDNKTYK